MHWQDFPDAPAPGTAVCLLSSLVDKKTTVLGIGDFEMLIVRRGAVLFGYVNLCPHQFLPLNHRKSDVTSADGKALLCSNHGMKFDIATGQGESCALSPVPLTIEGNTVKIA